MVDLATLTSSTRIGILRTRMNWCAIWMLHQISSAQVIVEANYGDFVVEPSFGTHFFQNLITFQIGYLTINDSTQYDFLDWDWLNSIETVSESGYVRHVRLEQPLNILIDGRKGEAVIFKPD